MCVLSSQRRARDVIHVKKDYLLCFVIQTKYWNMIADQGAPPIHTKDIIPGCNTFTSQVFQVVGIIGSCRCRCRCSSSGCSCRGCSCSCGCGCGCGCSCSCSCSC